MKFFRILLISLLIAGFILYKQGNEKVIGTVQSVLDSFQPYVNSVKKQEEISNIIVALEENLQSFKNELKGNGKEKQLDHPSLQPPEEQTFSVHNIEIGESKNDVEKLVGTAKRSSFNEYGVKWYTYHQNYHNFFMAAYDEQGNVAGLYTNQDLVSSKVDIKINNSKEAIVQKLGEPINGIWKGFVIYQVKSDGEYNIYEMDHSYVTIFFDKHESDTVTAIQIISKDLEQQKSDFFAAGSTALKEGFEYQLFDLTNAARVKNGLSVLSWDDQVKLTARAHSSDMAANHFFSHENLVGMSPFDRLEQDRIAYIAAGENIATGQVSSIFAHEGLMNSIGHRKNILSAYYDTLGVGVAFDSDSRPFYTENFIGR